MTTQLTLHPEQSELGKKSEYDPFYNPEKLFPISRRGNRESIGVDPHNLPFYGFDHWNHYEVSWLNQKGKPQVALAEMIFNCNTPNIIEAKSMKLYFNSFNHTKFNSVEEVEATIKKDLSHRMGGEISIKVTPIHAIKDEKFHRGFSGICIDQLDIDCSVYHIDSELLSTENHEVEETVYSDLLKSNCLVTQQPDWGSVQISYKGKKINHEGLLRYIVSFRNHNEFNEQCIERIFVDILRQCKPSALTVYGRYTRRGGIDINPYRSTHKTAAINNERLCRQ